MKRLLFFLLGILPMAAQAQDVRGSVWDDPMVLFYVVAGLVFVVAMLALVVAVFMLRVIKAMMWREASEKARKEGVELKPETGWWETFWQQANDFVPLEKEETIMLDHSYDGIRELDNHLPPWWKGLFYGSIVWGIIYLIVYHVTGSLPLSAAEYENEVVLANQQLNEMRAEQPGEVINEENVTVSDDPIVLQDGRATFESICASCHKVDGGGDIGPNLTDQYWKNGGAIQDVFRVITDGVSGTNMIAWGNSMSPEKISNVASFIMVNLQGSTPESSKAPEGELFIRDSTQSVESDSVTNQGN